MSQSPSGPHRPGTDAYLIWAELTGGRGLTGAPVQAADLIVDLLLECEPTCTADRLLRDGAVHAFDVVEGHDPRHLSRRVVSVRAPLALACAWARGVTPGITRVELNSERRAPGMTTPGAGASPSASPAAWSLPGRSRDRIATGQVMVVIDDGLAFLNRRFLDAGGRTRIAFFWDQGGVDGTGANASAGMPWRPNTQFGYGRELDARAIDRLRRQVRGVADEALIYERIGHVRARRDLLHGTHVADLACGAAGGDDRGAGARATIIMIQLPAATTLDTSGAGTAKHVLDALLYALARVGPRCDLVVNLSYGATAGPHDGSTLLELAVDAITRRERRAGRQFAVVLPAGNSLNSRGHAQVRVPGSVRSRTGQEALSWHLRHEDPTESFCELWYPRAASECLSVELLGPHGERVEPVGADSTGLLVVGGQVLGAVIHRREDVCGDGLSLVLIAMAPSGGAAVRGPRVSPGYWKVVLRNQEGMSLDVDAWIERDDSALDQGFAARQSRFLSTRPRLTPLEPDVSSDPVRRDGTGNRFAHGQLAVVVGAVTQRGNRPSDYGARSMPGRVGWPTTMRPGDRGEWQPGLRAAASLSGSRLLMNGSSVAAPQAARALLEVFARHPGRVLDEHDIARELNN